MSTEWDVEAGDYVERVLERKLLDFLFGKTVYDINVREYAYTRMAIEAVMEGYVVVKDEHMPPRVTIDYAHVLSDMDMSTYKLCVDALDNGCVDVFRELSA